MLRPCYVPVTQKLVLSMEQVKVRRWYDRTHIDRDVPGHRDKARELLTEATATYASGSYGA